MRLQITYILKEDFLLAFYNAFCTALTKSNIRASFYKSGLVLYDLESVIS